MSAQQLLLDRIEFPTIKLEAASEGGFDQDSTFSQIKFDWNQVKFLTRSSLTYSPEEAEDPRHFALRYGIKLEGEQVDFKLPYALEMEVVGFFRYVGGEEFSGQDRFRAVRFSGYQILYGAIREMVCNLTARSRFGMWQLPARSFGVVAKTRAEEDEVERQRLLEKASAGKAMAEPLKKARSRKIKIERTSSGSA